MNSLENLDEQIKDLLLINNGDINVNDFPYILKEAEEHGISLLELARRIRKVNETIDWRPYNLIDKLLEDYILKGSLSEKEAESIITDVENELQRPKVINFILSTIKKRSFLPREKNSFEYDSFKNRWMTDEAWVKYQKEKIEVEWLGEKAHSLAELGELSFRKPEDAKYFLRNSNYLVPSITTLTKSSSKADEFSKIIEGEPNLDKRYFKVIYHLHPDLPFRLLNQEFADVHSLFDKTATDYNLFVAASESYINGHIQIWLIETDPGNAEKLTDGSNYNNFLVFLYRINCLHPFYLNSIKFDTPEQLVQRTGTDVSIWYLIAEATTNNQLPVWFSGIGRKDWLDLYNEHLGVINTSLFYSDEEKKLAIVQFLIHIFNSGTPDPQIVSNQQKIQLLSVEGSSLYQHKIHLKLVNPGFTKAGINFDNNIDGIKLSNNTVTFWSLANTIEYTITLTIDALRLIKNKPYGFNILIDTEFQNLVIPVQVRVVFPKKAYLIQILKYAVFGGIFFAAVRYVTGVLTSSDSWFELPDTSYYVPRHYFAYFVGLVIFFGGLISSIFLIKKIEKI